jgi:hypothetical protein
MLYFCLCEKFSFSCIPSHDLDLNLFFKLKVLHFSLQGKKLHDMVFGFFLLNECSNLSFLKNLLILPCSILLHGLLGSFPIPL